nr:ribosomal protein L32 [Neoraimondia herzogiana]
MAVPKKRTSTSKKRIRKNIWKKKGYSAMLKASSMPKSLSFSGSTFYKFLTERSKPAGITQKNLKKKKK